MSIKNLAFFQSVMTKNMAEYKNDSAKNADHFQHANNAHHIIVAGSHPTSQPQQVVIAPSSQRNGYARPTSSIVRNEGQTYTLYPSAQNPQGQRVTAQQPHIIVQQVGNFVDQ